MALHRHRLVRYARLPNYRNCRKYAGHGDEKTAIETAIAKNRRDDIPKYLTDRWLADSTLYGSPATVRGGAAAWQAAGRNTPVLLPNSVNSNQLTALSEIFTGVGA